MAKKPGIRPAGPATRMEWTAVAMSDVRPAEPAGSTDPGAALADLAIRVANGEAAAFRALVEATHARLYRLALRMVGGAAEAEDVLQETYTRAWSALVGRPARDSIVAWLYAVARNVAADHARARRRRGGAGQRTIDDPAGLLSILADPAPSPRDQLESAELAAAVRRAVDGLPDKHRVILLLREVDGLAYDELAAALGCRLGTVESRLHRARAALARRLLPLIRRTT